MAIRLIVDGVRIGGVVRGIGYETTLPESEESDLVYRRWAVYVTRNPGSTRVQGERNIESLGASPEASAAGNQKAIALALSQGGMWSLMCPGIYNFESDTFAPASDSAILVGPGVVFAINGQSVPLVTLRDVVSYAWADGTHPRCGAEITVPASDSTVIVKASGAAVLTVVTPESGAGRAAVCNGDGLSDVAVSARHLQPAVRMTNSGSSIVLPTINLHATADAGWTFGMLVRINAENAQSGTTHLRFARVGAGSAYFLLGYEGPNASNPFVMKLLMPNAAASGVVSLRQGLSSPFSPFYTSRLGQWVWIFARKHDAALTEQILRMSDGAEVAGVFTDETITLAWAPVQAVEPTDTVVYAGTSGVSAGTFSAANAALTIGPDASNTGTFDVAKVFFLAQCVSAANLGKLATGKRPQDIGLTVNDSTDIYYDLTTTTAASLLDLCGGTAATSVTLAGSDARTPSADWPLVTQYMGNTAGARVEVAFADRQARALA